MSRNGKYCVICKKHWGRKKATCCSSSSLVNTVTTFKILQRRRWSGNIWFRNRVKYYDQDGTELNGADLNDPKRIYPDPDERLKYLVNLAEDAENCWVEEGLVELAKDPKYLDQVAITLAKRVFKVEGGRVSIDYKCAEYLAEMGAGANAAVPILAKILLLEQPPIFPKERSESALMINMKLRELISKAQEAAIQALKGIGTEEAKLALSSPSECVNMESDSSTSSSTGVCDICQSAIPKSSGFLLTTRQVVSAHSFWLDYYERHSSEFKEMNVNSYHEFTKNASLRGTSVWLMCGQQNPWLICETCIDIFDVNKSKAKEHALSWWRSGKSLSPEDSGAVPTKIAALD